MKLNTLQCGYPYTYGYSRYILNVLKGENIWQPGIQEVLEALH